MSAPDDAGIHRARERAILLVLASSGTFTLAAAAVKSLDGAIPMAQLILFRNLFALPLLLVMLMRAGGLALLRPRAPWGHVQRTISGMCGMIGAFAGYTYLPLATALQRRHPTRSPRNSTDSAVRNSGMVKPSTVAVASGR